MRITPHNKHKTEENRHESSELYLRTAEQTPVAHDHRRGVRPYRGTLPQREALVVRHQQLRYTWAELAEAVDRCARGLLALGLQAGERVGIWSPNNAQWCITQFATAKIGVVLVNINPAYRLSELEYALKQSGCRWLICADAFKTSDYHAMLHELLPELESAAVGALQSHMLPELRGVISLCDKPVDGMLQWQALMEMAEQVGPEQLRQCGERLQFDDPINIQYTSGTTGFPKGATLSHYNILNNGYMVGESLRLTEHDRPVIPVPLYHCFGMVMGNLGCVTHGTTMIYPSAAFEPLAALQAAAEEKATGMYGVPTMFIAMLDHPERQSLDLSGLRTGIMAGSTCPIEVMKRVIDDMHTAEMQIAYGMTETSPVSTQTSADDDRTPRHQRRPHPAAPGKQDRRRARRGCAARADRRTLHPRLQRDARLLEQPGRHPRGHRRRALDAHR